MYVRCRRKLTSPELCVQLWLTQTCIRQRVCARVADFQFNPNLFLDDSTTDGGGDELFDLEKWRNGLALAKLSMYFF